MLGQPVHGAGPSLHGSPGEGPGVPVTDNNSEVGQRFSNCDSRRAHRRQQTRENGAQ